MTRDEAEALLDAMMAAAAKAERKLEECREAFIIRKRTRPPTWHEWPNRVHVAIAAMAAARDAGEPVASFRRVSAEAACDVLYERFGVATCASTLDRYCVRVLGRKSFRASGVDTI